MSTLLNTNMSAITSQRNFRSATDRQTTAIERLRTGRRINRTGDGAATLAISEGMRNQIRGLDRATRNTQEGVSVVQVAEGALSEINERLYRIRDLTIQATDVLNRPYDKLVIKTEIRQLMKEVDLITHNTEFNRQRIFSGGSQLDFVREGQQTVIPPNISDAHQYFLDHVLSRSVSHFTDYATASVAPPGHWLHEFVNDATSNSWVGSFSPFPGFYQYFVGFYHEDRLQSWGRLLEEHVLNHIPGARLSNIGRDFFAIGVDRSDFVMQDFILNTATGGVLITSSYAEARTEELFALQNLNLTALGAILSIDFFEFDEDLISDSVTGGGDSSGTDEADNRSFNLQLQSGANSGQRLSIDINNVSLDILGLSDFVGRFEQYISITDINSNNEMLSTLLIDLDNAISIVSRQREDLGFTQNRLESVVSNLDNSANSLSDAFSNALNSDMATEALEVSKTTLLTQTAIAMMTQANSNIDAVFHLVNVDNSILHLFDDEESGFQIFENSESFFEILNNSITSFVEIANGDSSFTMAIRPRQGFRPVNQRPNSSLEPRFRLVNNVSFGHLSIHNNRQ